ncbi:MAG: Gfo/Idh/MocA family protein [Cyanophyceae cyanobacterium]
MTQLDSTEPTSRTIQVGIVGTGYAAKRRAEAFGEEPRSHLLAVAGHTQEHTAKFCQIYGGTPLSWQELVDLPNLDLVVICNVNSHHAEITRAALEADKHVVVEYPLALDPTQAQELIALAKQNNKLLHVEHIELLGGLHQAVRQHLSKIGTVFSARYTTLVPQRPAPRRWTYHREMFGFPLSGALSRIHRLTDLFGSVDSVSCQSRFWDASSGYFTACFAQAQLRFSCGVVADVVYGKGETVWRSDRTFELHGEKGTLIFAGNQGTLIQENETPIEVGGRRGLFAQDTQMVLDHLLDGSPLYVTPTASLYALKVADATRQATETGELLIVDH